MTTGTEQAEKTLTSVELQSGSQQQLTSHCAGDRSHTHRAATSVTGAGLEPKEGSGAREVPGGVGDTDGPKVAGAASVKLSEVAAGVAEVWALTAAQQPARTSRSGRRPGSPIAPGDPGAAGARGR